jgi:hypothetical protein
MHAYIRRFLRGYASAVITLNLACLPAVERSPSRGPCEADATASEVILSLLYVDSGGGVK